MTIKNDKLRVYVTLGFLITIMITGLISIYLENYSYTLLIILSILGFSYIMARFYSDEEEAIKKRKFLRDILAVVCVISLSFNILIPTNYAVSSNNSTIVWLVLFIPLMIASLFGLYKLEGFDFAIIEE